MALNHQEPDCVPLDLGGSVVTCMHVSIVYKLRQAQGLDAPGTPVKVVEPYQMLGEIKPDLMAAIGADVAGLRPTKTMFGFKTEGWKPWTMFDGTPVLVPGKFNMTVYGNGQGDLCRLWRHQFWRRCYGAGPLAQATPKGHP
jgi:hypothetical protein